MTEMKTYTELTDDAKTLGNRVEEAKELYIAHLTAENHDDALVAYLKFSTAMNDVMLDCLEFCKDSNYHYKMISHARKFIPDMTFNSGDSGCGDVVNGIPSANSNDRAVIGLTVAVMLIKRALFRPNCAVENAWIEKYYGIDDSDDSDDSSTTE